MSLWGELKRRKVFQVAAVYAVVAWLLVQIVATVEAPLNLPSWFDTAVIVLLAVGFPVTLIVSWAFNLTSEGLVRDEGSGPPAQGPGRTLEYTLIGLLGLAVSFLFVDDYLLTDRTQSDVAATEGTPPPGDTEAERDVLENSVAVLPLENLSPDPDNAYFAAGMHEEILNHLARLENLNVISRTSVLRYAENRPTIPEIASELNVEAVLEGSVRFDENSVLVTAQLIDAATDSHLWSARYERELAGVFAIQADIAMNVANALAAEFSDEEQQRIERRPTDSPDAYRLVLQAGNLLRVGGQNERIHSLLDRAIMIDPQFADAHGLKAGVYAAELINTTISSARSEGAAVEALARNHIERALMLDPENALALGVLGDLASFFWRWTEAQEAYDRVYEITNTVGGGPSLWFRAWSGRQAEALRLAEQQAELNPLSSGAHWNRGIVLDYVGDYDAAAASFREAIALDPTFSLQHSWLAWTEIARGNVEEARRELELTEELLGDNRVVISLIDLCYGYGRIGDIDNARRLFGEIGALADQGQDIGAGGWALVHLAVGNLEEALEQLGRGAEKARQHELDAGYFSLMNIRMNATADPVLERPEFVEARNRLRGD